MIDFNKIKTVPASQKEYKVTKTLNNVDFMKQDEIQANWLFEGQAKTKATDLIDLADRIVEAACNQAPVVFMMGAHLIKLGLAPIVCELMRTSIITHVAMNGAASIHDFELGILGKTSEDVKDTLKDGTFGMVQETPEEYYKALAQKISLPSGNLLGRYLFREKGVSLEKSILAASYVFEVSATTHIAIGTDILHQHPIAHKKAELIGRRAFKDFEVFTDEISRLEKGVVINFGSAVIMPEVFLKALSIVRNLGYKVENFTTANFDMIQHYRPNENVVNRPGGVGYTFTGHHEIMLPLLARLTMERLRAK